MHKIVLASTSPYRRELLARLRLPFTTAAPDVDEAPWAGEPPPATAMRLAQAKAHAVAQRLGDAVVIGSDQVASLDGTPLGKPGSRARAIEQLSRMQGRTVVFHTALAVTGSGTTSVACVDTEVAWRRLSPSTIEAYVDAEQPFDVAGAAKIEALGIALVERVTSPDPTALIGLPLITLVSMLLDRGITVPAAADRSVA